jgi:hypothetical protein
MPTSESPDLGTRLEIRLFPECDRAKETIGIVTRTGGEEELVGRSVGSSTLPELNGPKLIDLDWLATGIEKRPQELACLGIEGVNPAAGGIVADENRVAHWAEISGSLGNAPG